VWGFDLFGLGPLEHTWSLSIEEQFYILWPPILIMMLRRGLDRRVMLTLIGVGVVASGLWRLHVWQHATTWERPYTGLDTRGDALLIGCGLAVLFTAGWLPTGKWGRGILRLAATLATGVLIGFIATSRTESDHLYQGGFTAVAVATAVVIACLLVDPPRMATRVLSFMGLVWIGRISYGLYLWHLPVSRAVEKLPIPNALAAPLQFGLSILVAALSYVYVERRFLRLKDRLQPAERPSETTPAGTNRPASPLPTAHRVSSSGVLDSSPSAAAAVRWVMPAA
jgi:peptidoglycan/LPS O-acetylase OafA/YrhL